MRLPSNALGRQQRWPLFLPGRRPPHASHQSVKIAAQAKPPLQTRPAEGPKAKEAVNEARRPRGAGGEVPHLVQHILSSPDLEAPEGSSMLDMLKLSESYWKALRNSKDEPGKRGPTVVKRVPGEQLAGVADYDVCVCGGTLGVLLGLALQKRGHRVCILEKRKLEGRNQEWNIGRSELGRLVDAGLLSQEELEACIVSEFNPVRVGLRGMGEDLWVDDVLNLGVQPRLLLGTLKRKFLEAGGALFEHTAFRSAEVFDDGVRIRTLSAHSTAADRQGAAAGAAAAELALTQGDVNRPLACSSGAGERPSGSSSSSSSSHASEPSAAAAAPPPPPQPPATVTCRLVLDCMGHFGPIVKQIRGGAKPTGMVVVVGGAMAGVPQEKNTSADLLYSFADSEDDLQLFWEAFPAAGGDRTVYAFCYTDAHPQRPTFAALLDKYFRALPEYQGVPLDQLKFKRVLFGAFPCYPSASPLPPAFDRVLQVGDAAAGQSPLSFGGFGAMVRHLGRLTEGVHDALQADLLSQQDLSWLQPYQPSLSAAWLFQRAMSVGVGQLRRDKGSARSQQLQQAEPAAPAAAPFVQHVQPPLGALSNAVAAAGLRHEPVDDEAPTNLQQQRRQAAGAAPASTSAVAAGATSAAAAAASAEPHHSSGPAAAAATAAPSQPGPAPASATVPLQAPAAAAAEREGSGWLDPGHINALMRANFLVMKSLGDWVIRPFLSDSFQFWPLALTMAGMSFRAPLTVLTVVRHLGVLALLDWTRHFLMLGAYALLHAVLRPLAGWVRRWGQGAGATGAAAAAGSQQVPGRGQRRCGRAALLKGRYVFLRMVDALGYGSGAD